MTNYFTLHFSWIIAFLLVLGPASLPLVPLCWIFLFYSSLSLDSSVQCPFCFSPGGSLMYSMRTSLRSVISLALQPVCLCLLQWPVPCHAANQQLLAFSDQSRELENEEWSFHSSSLYWMVVLHATLTWHLWLIVSWKYIFNTVGGEQKARVLPWREKPFSALSDGRLVGLCKSDSHQSYTHNNDIILRLNSSVA